MISRHMTGRVRQSLQDTPAVLVNGPRKCGKTTLAKQFAHGMQYITLDDATALEVARLDAEREPIRLSARDIKELAAFLGPSSDRSPKPMSDRPATQH